MGTQRPHPTEPWTNEKHMYFLNSIEASFVRSMFQNNINDTDIVSRSSDSRPLRLDRYIPDSCESTLDSTPGRPRRTLHTASSTSSDNITAPPTTRRHPSRISNSSNGDQVVPNCKDEKAAK